MRTPENPVLRGTSHRRNFMQMDRCKLAVTLLAGVATSLLAHASAAQGLTVARSLLASSRCATPIGAELPL